MLHQVSNVNRQQLGGRTMPLGMRPQEAESIQLDYSAGSGFVEELHSYNHI